jgi:hypothetical protein
MRSQALTISRLNVRRFWCVSALELLISISSPGLGNEPSEPLCTSIGSPKIGCFSVRPALRTPRCCVSTFHGSSSLVNGGA